MPDEGDDAPADNCCQPQGQFVGAFVKGLSFVYNDRRLWPIVRITAKHKNWNEDAGSFMPLYEYECRNCGIRFERQQRMVDAALTLCPECGENALFRVIQPVGIIFKGSGFYVTDNRGKSSTGPSAVKSETSKDASKEAVTPPKNEASDASQTKTESGPALPPSAPQPVSN